MRLFKILAVCAVTAAIPALARAAEAEVEVLAKGPVHEAYAEPSERQPVASPVVPKEPPQAIEELPPDQKPEGENVQWLPGYWAYDEDRKDFVWVSGFWRVPPPARTWMPGSWQKAGDGWQWSGGLWAPVQAQKAELEYLPPPPKPLDEDGASIPAPAADQVYIPGSWVYRQRFVWRPGYWSPYRANWIWQSAHYRWTPCGHIFIDGYWDYPLAARGVLFAPAYIPPVFYADPGYVYAPTYIVREPCLYGAFFARRGYGSYYFGDYFAPNYASIGFTAWNGHISATVRLGGFYDPLFSHYSIGFGGDPFWGGGGLNNLYAGRYRGDYARPPVNFVQQTTVINNITNVKNVTNVNNVQMLSTLKDAPKTTQVKLAAVSETARKQQQTQARDLRTIGVKRSDQEVKLVSTRPMTGGTTPAAPRSVKLDVPTNLHPLVSAPVIDPAKPGHTLPKADHPLAGVAPKGTTPDPKVTLPKVDPKPVIPMPLPKVDPKVTLPKVDPKPVIPMPLPKVEPRPVVPNPLPKVEPKPVIPAPKPVIPMPKVEPKVSIAPPVTVPAPRPAPVPVPAPAPVAIPRPAPIPAPAPAPAPVVIPRPAPAPAPAPIAAPPPAPAPIVAPPSRPAPAPPPKAAPPKPAVKKGKK